MSDPSIGEPLAIDVRSWTDLAGLPDDMAMLEVQFGRICDHARRWMCQRDGFEPSPVCLLRPLGELVGIVADVVDATEVVVRAEWADLTAGVTATAGDLRRLDQAVADRLPPVR